MPESAVVLLCLVLLLISMCEVDEILRMNAQSFAVARDIVPDLIFPTFSSIALVVLDLNQESINLEGSPSLLFHNSELICQTRRRGSHNLETCSRGVSWL